MSYLLRSSVKNIFSKISSNKIILGKNLRSIMSKGDSSKEKNSEYKSWENSLPELLEILRLADLHNVHVVFEYDTPVGGRIDALVIGYNHQNIPTVLIVELKQWSRINDNIEKRETEVLLKLGNDFEYRIHPLQQILTYEKSLKNHHEFCENSDFKVEAIAYLHNFQEKNTLISGTYSSYEKISDKIFVSSEKNALIEKMKKTFQNKDSSEITNRFLEGSYVLGKTGYEGIVDVVNKKENAVMIQDQIEINKSILEEINDFQIDQKSRLIIVKGGPGTGKTILGLHILYAYLAKSHNKNDKALFTFATSRTLRQIIEGEVHGQVPILNDKNIKGKDLIIIDEAHRFNDIEKNLNKYYRDSPKFIIVLQDDNQRIRINENGTFNNFINYGRSKGIVTKSYELEVQKRSGIFGDYIKIIDNFFYNNNHTETSNITFDLSIEDSLNNIDAWLFEQKSNNSTAKWFAGFCWEWTRNTSNNDIVINSKNEVFKKPWNPMNNQYEWYKNYANDSLNQVGCIYTAQGLDFDYTGVIWGKDLRWNKRNQEWIANLEHNKDYMFTKQFENTDATENDKIILLKNTYRVLLTRALKGTKVWFEDKDTEEYFRNYFQLH